MIRKSLNRVLEIPETMQISVCGFSFRGGIGSHQSSGLWLIHISELWSPHHNIADHYLLSSLASPTEGKGCDFLHDCVLTSDSVLYVSWGGVGSRQGTFWRRESRLPRDLSTVQCRWPPKGQLLSMTQSLKACLLCWGTFLGCDPSPSSILYLQR